MKCLFKSFANFLGFVEGVLYIFCVFTPYGLQVLSFTLLVFLLLYRSFNIIQLVYFCFCSLYLWCNLQEIIAKTSILKVLVLQSFFHIFSSRNYMLVLYSFDYCCFVICFGIKKCESPNLFFFLNIILAIRVLWDSIRILNSFFSYFCKEKKKKCHWYFDRDCIESVDHIGYYGQRNGIKSSSSWILDGCLFLLFCLSALFCNFQHTSVLLHWLSLFLSILFFLMLL